MPPRSARDRLIHVVRTPDALAALRPELQAEGVTLEQLGWLADPAAIDVALLEEMRAIELMPSGLAGLVRRGGLTAEVQSWMAREALTACLSEPGSTIFTDGWRYLRNCEHHGAEGFPRDAALQVLLLAVFRHAQAHGGFGGHGAAIHDVAEITLRLLGSVDGLSAETLQELFTFDPQEPRHWLLWTALATNPGLTPTERASVILRASGVNDVVNAMVDRPDLWCHPEVVAAIAPCVSPTGPDLAWVLPRVPAEHQAMVAEAVVVHQRAVGGNLADQPAIAGLLAVHLGPAAGSLLTTAELTAALSSHELEHRLAAMRAFATAPRPQTPEPAPDTAPSSRQGTGRTAEMSTRHTRELGRSGQMHT